MGNTIGGTNINVKNYKCSIKCITVKTKWKVPDDEVDKDVQATVFKQELQKFGPKTIYLVTSQKGKDITIATKREANSCPREDHKRYVMKKGNVTINNLILSGYQNKYSPGQNLTAQLANNKNNANAQAKTNTSTNKSCQYEGSPIKAEEERKIKCYELKPEELFKFFKLPVPTGKEKDSTYNFKYITCTEGSFNFTVIAYPDVKFELEFSIGIEESKKKQGGFSHFEKNAMYIKNVAPKAGALIEEKDTDVKFAPPSLTAKATFNGKRDELEVKLDFDTSNEIFNIRYKKDSQEIELGTEGIQEFIKRIKKFADMVKFLKEVCSAQFIKDFIGLKKDNLANNYKPYKLELNLPAILFSYTGQYHTAQNLGKIGKYYGMGIAVDPLIGLTFTIDLLYLILTALSAGTATGFYVLLKNLDKVIGKLLGSDYKKTYKDTKPFEADVYFNLVISGAINGSAKWIIDTANTQNKDTLSAAIEGELKVDIEAGAKASIDLFVVAVEGEASASASTGIKLKLRMDQEIQNDELAVVSEGFFLGIKVEYCIKGQAGSMKTISYGASFEGEANLLDTTEIFSKKWYLA